MSLLNRVLAVIAVLTVLASLPVPSLAQPASPAAAPTEKPASIHLNGSQLAPGEVLQTLFGVAGPPDVVQAVRGKEPVNDFVKFGYNSYGISVHLKNDKSHNTIVDAIVVLQGTVRINNIPFKIGDDYKLAMQAWGQPDRQEPGFMAYWKRGVYVGVAEDGRIIHITLVPPGKFDEEPPAQKGGHRPGVPEHPTTSTAWTR